MSTNIESVQKQYNEVTADIKTLNSKIKMHNIKTIIKTSVYALSCLFLYSMIMVSSISLYGLLSFVPMLLGSKIMIEVSLDRIHKKIKEYSLIFATNISDTFYSQLGKYNLPLRYDFSYIKDEILRLASSSSNSPFTFHLGSLRFIHNFTSFSQCLNYIETPTFEEFKEKQSKIQQPNPKKFCGLF